MAQLQRGSYRGREKERMKRWVVGCFLNSRTGDGASLFGLQNRVWSTAGSVTSVIPCFCCCSDDADDNNNNRTTIFKRRLNAAVVTKRAPIEVSK